MTILLATAAATLFMTGVGWFVQVVHYPLLRYVGAEAFDRYHQAHSRLTTRVVVLPMLVELAGSALLVAERPPGVGAGLAWAGLALALATWLSTAAIQVPRHRTLTPDGVTSLVAGTWLRTVAWTAHSGLVLAMLASAH
ncbi:MAG TPA: hypothetical protein VEW45_05015 [Candidatus Dormibacteraeota bacterium]|nr:hypothetical protein [Candidatus Dormibacteraeota bacterium]